MLSVWGFGFDSKEGEVGELFVVMPFESPCRMIPPVVMHIDLSVGPDRVLLPVREISGSIWKLDKGAD